MPVNELHSWGCLLLHLNIISPQVLSVDDCSWWVIAVIDGCPLCSLPHVTFWSVSLKLIIYSSGQSVLLDQRLLSIHCCSIRKIAVMHRSEPKSYNKPFVLHCSWDFGFRGQWSRSRYRNSFWQSRLLTMTLQPCSLLFNAQVMILQGVMGFQPCLCICRWVLPQHHHHPLWHVKKRPGKRVRAKGWQAWSRFFKTIDTYEYIKNSTNSPYVPKMYYDCPYERWLLLTILVEWVIWFTRAHVCIATWLELQVH